MESLGIDAGTILAALVTFALAYVLARAVTLVLTHLSERTVERRITIKAFAPAARFTIYVVAVILVLGPMFDLAATQYLAFSGVLGAVLGLGLKDLFANVVGGFVVVFERPYTAGDKIELGDYYGEVTTIGLRSTRLVTNDDDEISVPNHKVFTESLANANGGDPELMAVPELHLEHGEDIQTACEVLRDAMRSSRYVYVSDDHPVFVRVTQHPAYVTLRGRAYVNDVRHEFVFQSDVTRRAVAAFDEADIAYPDVAIVTGD